MIVEECKYNPLVDMKPVDSFGFLDLASAYVNKTVPSDTVTQDADYNGIDDPASILGKPRDVFDALRLQDRIKASAKSAESVGSGEKSE